MGLSHQAIINAHPAVDLVAVCDTTKYLLDFLSKYAGVRTYTDYRKMLSVEAPDAVFIATPSKFHVDMVQAALDAGCHVFCEKPFCLDVNAGLKLTDLAEAKKLVNQVGYHYRFVATFAEMKRLLERGAVGKAHHIFAEAYGPVVLKEKGSTWRTSRSEGGGCLYDYASHAIDLMNYLVGRPDAVGGTALHRLFSRDVEDEVYASFFYNAGLTGQLAANWSDRSHRKMSTKVTVWGRNGKMVADRQELRVYLRDARDATDGLKEGWNVRYTTELTQPVWFYLRGEEYSAQIDHFVGAIQAGRTDTRSTFRTALEADMVAAAMERDAGGDAVPVVPAPIVEPAKQRFWQFLRPSAASPG